MIVMSLIGMLAMMLGAHGFDAPPRDLASLLSPTEALEQMEVGTDEASLIALLEARDEPKPTAPDLPGPPRDTDYVKQLLAIRALEATGSQKALAVLKEIAAEGDVTLADAAAEAAGAIGAKYP